MSHTILITGANRGIGRELTKQYALDGWKVIATCRTPEAVSELQEASQAWSFLVHCYPLEVSSADSIQALANTLQGQAIDILFNNAGVYGPKEMSVEGWLKTFEVNTIAPYQITQALLSNVAASQKKTIAIMTSKMGSIADNGSGGAYIYRSSKAAVNAVTKSLAMDLASQGIKAVCLHPGWVQTDMGGPNALITTETCVQGIKSTLAQLSDAQSGSFLNYDGSVIPW